MTDKEHDCGAGDAIRTLLMRLPKQMSDDRQQALMRAFTALANYGWGSVDGHYLITPTKDEPLIPRERLYGSVGEREVVPLSAADPVAIMAVRDGYD